MARTTTTNRRRAIAAKRSRFAKPESNVRVDRMPKVEIPAEAFAVFKLWESLTIAVYGSVQNWKKINRQVMKKGARERAQ